MRKLRITQGIACKFNYKNLNIFLEYKLGREYSEANKFFAQNVLFTDSELFNIMNPKGRAINLWWCNNWKKTKDYNQYRGHW